MEKSSLVLAFLERYRTISHGIPGIGIGRKFAEFRENVFHSPRRKKLTHEKKILGSFFSRGVQLIFRRSEATYLPQHHFGIFVVRVRSRSTSSLAPSTKCKHVFDVSNSPTR